MRLEFGDPLEQWPAGAALSHVQARDSAPIVLWSRFGASQAGDAQFGFAFIVPIHLAPGKTVRWTAWALSPAVATYREFGLRAYLSGAEICVQGSQMGSSRSERVNGCAVIAARLRTRVREGVAPARGAEFRLAARRPWPRADAVGRGCASRARVRSGAARAHRGAARMAVREFMARSGGAAGDRQASGGARRRAVIDSKS
jgi:hypothetical protein